MIRLNNIRTKLKFNTNLSNWRIIKHKLQCENFHNAEKLKKLKNISVRKLNELKKKSKKYSSFGKSLQNANI